LPSLTSPFRQRREHFAHRIACVEFAPTLEGGNNSQPGLSAHDSEHHVFGLNCDTFPIRSFSIRRQPYKFMICNVLEPGLIQGHGVVPGSLLLCPKYRQKGPRSFNPCCFLIVGQDMWRLSVMTRGTPEFLRESPIYHGFW
jgi:hypothetical protein